MSGRGLCMSCTSICVCMYDYLGFMWGNFNGVNGVLGVCWGVESDSDVIEAVRVMVDDLWLSLRLRCGPEPHHMYLGF